MRSRRPYASRGVPRRATTRRAHRSVPAVVALAAVVGLLVAVVVWVANPFEALTARKETTTVGFRAVAGQAAAAADAGAGAAAGVAPGDATPAATTRHWDAAAPGIVVDPVLASRLDQVLLGVEGHVGLAIKDLGSGRGAVLGGNLELAAASLYKLPVLFTVFDVGLRMAEDLQITDEALSY